MSPDHELQFHQLAPSLLMLLPRWRGALAWSGCLVMTAVLNHHFARSVDGRRQAWGTRRLRYES